MPKSDKILLIAHLTLLCFLINTSVVKGQSRYQITYSDANTTGQVQNFVRDLEQDPTSGDLFVLSWDERQTTTGQTTSSRVTRTTSEGDTLWSKQLTLGTNTSFEPEDLVIHQTGFAIAGQVEDNDVYLANYDFNGSLVWAKSYVGFEAKGIDFGQYYGNQMLLAVPGGGFAFATHLIDPVTGGGKEPVLIITDANGNVINSAKTDLSNSGYNSGGSWQSLVLAQSGNIVATGMFLSDSLLPRLAIAEFNTSGQLLNQTLVSEFDGQPIPTRTLSRVRESQSTPGKFAVLAANLDEEFTTRLFNIELDANGFINASNAITATSSTTTCVFASLDLTPSPASEFAVIASGANICSSSSGAETVTLKYSEAVGFEWAKVIGASGYSSLITAGIVAQDGDLVFAGNELNTTNFEPVAMVLTKVGMDGELSDECLPGNAPITASEVSVTTLQDTDLELQAPLSVLSSDITSQITSTLVAVEQQVVCKSRRGLFPCQNNFPGGGICRSAAGFDTNDSDYDKGLGITEDQNIGGGCVEVITICDDPSVSYDIKAMMGWYQFNSPEEVAPCGKWVVEQVPSNGSQGWTGSSGVANNVGSLQNLIQVNTLTFPGNPPGGTGGNFFTASSATFTPPGTLTQPLEVGVYLRRGDFCSVCPTSPNGKGTLGDSRIRPVVFRILPRPTVNASVKQLTCEADQEVAFAIEIELVNPVSLFNSPDDASIFRASSLYGAIVPFTAIDVTLFDGNGNPIGSIPNYTITQSSSGANIQNASNLISLPPGTSSAGPVQIEVEIRDANTIYPAPQTGLSNDGSLPDPGCTTTLQVPFPIPVTIDADFDQVSAIGPCQTGTGQSEVSACVDVTTNAGDVLTIEWIVEDNFGFTDIAAISTIAPGQSTVCITDAAVSLPGTPTFLMVIITDESTGCTIERTIELNVEGSTPGCVATTPSVILPSTASLINEAAFPPHDPQNNQNVIVVNPGSVSILEDAPTLLVSCGDFIVDKDLTIRGGTIQVAEGARIIVEPGIEFTLLGTTIESCGDFLWEGIVSNRGNVNIVDSPNPNNLDETIRSNIRDAFIGVQFNSSLGGGSSAGFLTVNQSNFANNIFHMSVEFANENVTVIGSNFTSNSLLFKSNQFNLDRTSAAASFRSCSNVIFGAQGTNADDADINKINDAVTGVRAVASDLEVWNTQFNIEAERTMLTGVSIFGTDANNQGDRAVRSDGLVNSCNFSKFIIGVGTQEVTSLSVHNSTFVNSTNEEGRLRADTKGVNCTRLQWESTGNPPQSSRIDPINATEGLVIDISDNNIFTNLDYGVQIDDCDAATIRIGDPTDAARNTFIACDYAIEVVNSTSEFFDSNPGSGFSLGSKPAITYIENNFITNTNIGITHARDKPVAEVLIDDNDISDFALLGIIARGVGSSGPIGPSISRNTLLNGTFFPPEPGFFNVNVGIAVFNERRSTITENIVNDNPNENKNIFQIGFWQAATNASSISCNFINNQVGAHYVQGPNSVSEFTANALGAINIGQYFDSNGSLGPIGNPFNSSDNVWSSGSASFITSANTSPNHTRYFVSPTACQIPASFVFPGQVGVLQPPASIVGIIPVFGSTNCELDNCISGSPGSGVPAAGNTPISQQTEAAYEAYGEDLVTNQVQMNTLPQSTRAMERASLYDYMRARPSFGQFRWKLKLFRWLYQNQPGGRLWLADRLIARQRYFLAHAVLNNVNPSNPVDSTRKEVLSIKLEAAALNADTLTPQLRQDLMNLSMLCYNQFGQGVLEARASLGSVSDSTVVAWILADSCSGFLDVLDSTVANNSTRRSTFSTPENDPPVEQGIENLDQALMVSFYPNPVATNLNIRFSNVLSEGVLQLTDMSGKVVHTEQLQQLQAHQLDVSGIADGTYLVSITTGSGKQFVHKVTVKH